VQAANDNVMAKVRAVKKIRAADLSRSMEVEIFIMSLLDFV
jgi:hypothetical protein